MKVFYKGDTLATLKTQIRDKSVNLIYVNPPFGTTGNFWDEKQDWPKLFAECFRVLKNDGMLVIHCSVPFNYELIRAAPKPPAYSWYWKKEGFTCPFLANYQPLRIMEEILVWKNKKNTYYRQNIGDEERSFTHGSPGTYYSPTIKPKTATIKGKTRTHFLDMKRNIKGFSTRPDEMIDLFIKSYSKPGDTVLDMFCYKGVSSRFCSDRKWIGIDKYFFPDILVNDAKQP
jgi:site-specific DNA-methyltransferase (adenine-specific)